MKQQLDGKTTAITFVVIAVVVLVGGFLYYNDTLRPTPTVTPKPWKPPGAWGGSPTGAAPSNPGTK